VDGQRRWVVHSGKVEIGQGIHTALRQIAASALGCDIAQVLVASPSTARSPDEGTTSGSRSVEDGGALVFGACRTLVAVLRERSADAPLLSRVTPEDLALPVDAYFVTARFEGALIGHDARRAEFDRKLFGTASFVQDLQLDGMLHARMLRGPWHRGVATNLDQLRNALPPGVQWFADGNFVALLSDDEDRLVKALQRCRERAEWDTAALQAIDPNDPEWLMRAPCETSTLVDQPGTPATEGRRHTARYTRPYLAHAPIGPSCALASFVADVLQVWTHSQGIFNLRAEIAGALHLPLEAVVVHHAEGSGCYGHNGADDAAFDAALLAFRLHKPVRVQWMREDEFSSAPFGPATAVQVSAVLTPTGRIADWQFDSWGAGHHSRPGSPSKPRLLGAWQMAESFAETMPANLPMAMGGGAERNALPLYAFDGAQVRVHRITAPPVRSSSLRGLGALANVFAIESFIDELAMLGGLDPVELRLQHLEDQRAITVLRDAVARSPWAAWRASPPDNQGVGCAVARYKGSGGWCAVVACVEVDDKVRVRDLYVSVDLGTLVNPDGARSQVEGGAVQATSWALLERVGFDAGGVATRDWESYPILRFSDVPRVHVHAIGRPDEPTVGAGEVAQGPTVAAIANALQHALGVRVRDLPMTFERVAQAMDA
jgi:CO/xanthine dehydrogenase Mo-binding subunit